MLLIDILHYWCWIGKHERSCLRQLHIRRVDIFVLLPLALSLCFPCSCSLDTFVYRRVTLDLLPQSVRSRARRLSCCLFDSVVLYILQLGLSLPVLCNTAFSLVSWDVVCERAEAAQAVYERF